MIHVVPTDTWCEGGGHDLTIANGAAATGMPSGGQTSYAACSNRRRLWSTLRAVQWQKERKKRKVQTHAPPHHFPPPPTCPLYAPHGPQELPATPPPASLPPWSSHAPSPLLDGHSSSYPSGGKASPPYRHLFSHLPLPGTTPTGKSGATVVAPVSSRTRWAAIGGDCAGGSPRRRMLPPPTPQPPPLPPPADASTAAALAAARRTPAGCGAKEAEMPLLLPQLGGPSY